MEARDSSRKLISIYQPARNHTQEGSNLHCYISENLKLTVLYLKIL